MSYAYITCISCGQPKPATIDYFRTSYQSGAVATHRCWHCEEGLGKGDHLPHGPEGDDDMCFSCKLPDCDITDSRCLLTK